MGSVEELLIDSLKELEESELTEFHWRLKAYNKCITKSEVEKAVIFETVDKMVACFGPEEAVKAMVYILKKMNQNDLAEKLENEHKQGSPVHQVDQFSPWSQGKLFQNHLPSPVSLLQSSVRMSKIIVFSKEVFEGRTVEFKNDVRSLEEKGFNNVISSLKVIGAPWVAYYDKNFTGKQHVFEEGEYATLDDKGMFSSLRIITDDLDNPEIQMFEHADYQGRSVTLYKETNLPDIAFSDIASSHKVKGGVWVLYEQVNRKGTQIVSFPGDEVPSYLPLSFNNMASHVRPLLPKP